MLNKYFVLLTTNPHPYATKSLVEDEFQITYRPETLPSEERQHYSPLWE